MLRASTKAPTSPLAVTTQVMKMKSASSPMWNITRPETSTAPRGQDDGDQGQAHQLLADRPQAAQAKAAIVPIRQRPEADADPDGHASNR